MFISLEEFQEHPLRFDESFGPGRIDYQSEGLRQVGELNVVGVATLSGQEIQVKGRLITELELSCARCLEPTYHLVRRSFDLCYQPLVEAPQTDELEVPRGEEEVGFYQGEGLVLEDLAREQVLLTLPMRSLCRDDCKGLCLSCGANWNREVCKCETHSTDERWDALKRI